jgi:hypothetical protein
VILKVIADVQALANAVGSLLWPLFVRDAFGWESAEFAVLLLLSSIFSTAAIAVLPFVEASLGPLRAAATAFGCASVTCLGAFAVGVAAAAEEDVAGDAVIAADPPGGGGRLWAAAVHSLFAICFFASLAMLEPSLKSLASSARPSSEGGRSFGAFGLRSHPADT